MSESRSNASTLTLDRAGYPLACDVAGGAVVWPAGPGAMTSLVVTGAAGSGKSNTMSSLAFAAAAAGDRVYVLDLGKRGADYAFLGERLTGLASELDEVADILNSVYETARFHESLINPPRILLLVEDFAETLRPEAIVPGRSEAASRGTRARNDLRHACGVSLARIAREGAASGVHLVCSAQQASRAGELRTERANEVMKHSSWLDFGGTSPVGARGEAILVDDASLTRRVSTRWFNSREALL